MTTTAGIGCAETVDLLKLSRSTALPLCRSTDLSAGTGFHPELTVRENIYLNGTAANVEITNTLISTTRHSIFHQP